MSICLLRQDGEIVLHRTMQAAPAPLLQAIAPYRDDLVIAVACLLTWYGRAALWAQEGLPVVLGHALYRKAMQGGTTKNDTLDSQKIAGRLRGGLLPQADGSPAARRATRALLRRRTPLLRKRAEVRAHLQQTTSQYTLPAIGKQSADKAHRDGVAERFPAPAVHKSIAGDLALLGHDDQLLRDGALAILHTAPPHQAQTLSLLRPVPGSGELLS